MINTEQDHELLHAQGDGHLIPNAAALPSEAGAPRRKMGVGQKLVVLILLTVVAAPSVAGIYSYFSGIPLHLLASSKEKEENEGNKESAPSSIKLVSDRAHTLDIGDDVAAALQIRKGERDAVAVARPPATMRPLVLPGSTSIIPGWLARVRARFAPAKVIEIAKVWDRNPKTGMTEHRELREEDKVTRGALLAVFYSVDVGSKKNDLLNALVQLELDQQIMDKVEAHREAVAEWYYLTQLQQVQKDRNEISRAINNLKTWDIPQEDIDALHEEARKIASDKNAWSKTAEGRWVKGENLAKASNASPGKDEEENPWGRVTLRAPFDGVIVEKNVHVGETVVDNTINLFQIADVSRLRVVVHCPEDELPTLDALVGAERRWTVRTVFAPPEGLPGTIDSIGYLIDPNQRTAVIKGYFDNPGERIRGTQYATATVNIPPPRDVVEIPADALVEDGVQAVVFVQPDPTRLRFTMRRVQVTHRFDRTVFVRSTPIPKEEQLTAVEAEEGLLLKEPLQPGERVLETGAVELKAALADLESRPRAKPADALAKGASAADQAKPPAQATGSESVEKQPVRPASNLDMRRVPAAKAGQG